MIQRVKPADAATRAWLKGLYEQPMPEADFLARVDAPMSDEERDNILELIDWFMRRYPTPTERLKYARRRYRQWTAGSE